MQTLLNQFVASFQKAIRAEMDAMRQQMGPFEVPLTNGQALDEDADAQTKLYQFQVLQPNEKLVLHSECTLAFEGGQVLVTIDHIARNEVRLKANRSVPLHSTGHTLVIYPWFLYERLLASLESLLEDDSFFIQNALTVFGKMAPVQKTRPLTLNHASLNDSQQQAVQLCSDSNLAFVWGPPGTGKTTTLGHIVTELLSQGYRILITSTTNAAVDQALAKLAELETAERAIKQGNVVRIGQTSAETFGTSLHQVVNRLNDAVLKRLNILQRRLPNVKQQMATCQHILDKLVADRQPLQLGLFQEIKSDLLNAQDLATLFSPKRIPLILAMSTAAQQALIIRRRKRLEIVQALGQATVKQIRADLQHQESAVVRQAQVILTTMTNAYISPLINAERFDVVIIEEAGMAILPTLFYCAALAQQKAILVGDPKQLPPIVQSKDTYVHKAMGRNIFDVTVPRPDTSGQVVMLDTQYRMHPAIGELVSTLFYAGKLRHGSNTTDRQIIAAKQPYPDAPLVVVDTEGQTTCTTREGSFSRFNEKSAQLCIDLALEAVQDGIETVAIITPYAAQSRLIRQGLARFRTATQRIECHTVHRFQGNERDLVIFDTVDTDPFKPGVLLSGIGPFSSADNLINVSLSRARGKLIIVSDVAYFQRKASNSAISVMLQQAIANGIRTVQSIPSIA